MTQFNPKVFEEGDKRTKIKLEHDKDLPKQGSCTPTVSYQQDGKAAVTWTVQVYKRHAYHKRGHLRVTPALLDHGLRTATTGNLSVSLSGGGTHEGRWSWEGHVTVYPRGEKPRMSWLRAIWCRLGQMWGGRGWRDEKSALIGRRSHESPSRFVALLEGSRRAVSTCSFEISVGSVLRPEGAQQSSPGQRPGKRRAVRSLEP